jgi:hypothetical protein
MRRIVVLLAVLAACPGSRQPSEDVLFAARTYAEGVRWRRYEDAAAHLRPAERERFLDLREKLDKDLRIDDYEVTRVKTGGEAATIQVVYTWHLDSVGTVRETTVEQRWVRERAGWIMIEERERRGDDMPGIVDREAAAPEGGDGPASAPTE